MPSPFPGMDPYLESPDIWWDFHHAFAVAISRDLNASLPRPYYARLGTRPEMGIVEDGGRRPVITPCSNDTARDAVLDRPRMGFSPSLRVRLPDEPLRHLIVEIRDASRGHALVTRIETVSPSNKHPGADRRGWIFSSPSSRHMTPAHTPEARWITTVLPIRRFARN